VALCEGLVQAIDRLFKACREINPDFRSASEFGYDRLIPYYDVGYRNAGGNEISTLKYVFPEWTSCSHISAPRDFRGVNGAVLTGAVLCIEPGSYQGSLDQPIYLDLANYVKEINRIRTDLSDYIFTGDYFDDQGGKIEFVGSENSVNAPGLAFKVHGNHKTGKRAIVIVNYASEVQTYKWSFTDRIVREVVLYSPFTIPRTIKAGDPVEIKAEGLQILIEK
jgi:hypothetical protein